MTKYRFLILRRFSQILILLLFVVCANSQDESLKTFFSGNLNSSKIFWVIPLSDPFSVAQIFFAGIWRGVIIGSEALLGLLIVLFIYGLFLGRGYCAFVCPMNLITDLSAKLRRIFGIESKKLNFTRKIKYGILFLSLFLSAIFGFSAFDLISPISMLHRGLIYGMGAGIFGILCVGLFDLFFIKNGFCGYLCPLGATYSLIGKFSLLRIKHKKELCSDCKQCFIICPEPQVLNIINKKSGSINNIDCLKCARCVEVCEDGALKYGIFDFKKE